MQQQLINSESTNLYNHANKTISKSQLAKKLRITRNTLLRFHRDFALEYISDYDISFPRVNGELKDELPLSKYQAWVLTKLIHMYLNVPTILIQVELSKEDVLESFDFASFSKFN
jgi:hypothetical protein